MKALIKVFFLIVSIESSFAEGVFINTSIKEASGVMYHELRNTLFVVEDEGKIFELTLDGRILREKKLGDYDLEGVTNGFDFNELILAVEGVDNLLVVDVDSFKVIREYSIGRKYKGHKILKMDKKHGIEGIVNFEGRIFLVNQSYNLKTGKKVKDPSMVFEVKRKGNNKFHIVSINHIPIPDLAGMAERNGLLYLLSDNKDLILAYDYSSRTIIERIQLSNSWDQEGIDFDNDGNLYLAIDGKGVYKINKFDK
ncbi:hypothetical protein HOG21_02275 [bacterium]|jgi:uncharacterized protein YjiK|nr:hypothetical protein [bacterium]